MKQCSSEKSHFQANFGRAGTWYWVDWWDTRARKHGKHVDYGRDGHATEMAKPQVFALAKDVKEAVSQSTFFNCSSRSLRLTYRGNSR